MREVKRDNRTYYWSEDMTEEIHDLHTPWARIDVKDARRRSIHQYCEYKNDEERKRCGDRLAPTICRARGNKLWASRSGPLGNFLIAASHVLTVLKLLDASTVDRACINRARFAERMIDWRR